MASVLSQFSEGLADAVAQAGNSIVRVEGRRRLPATGIVFSNDGVIVTAHHVVERDESITIGLPNGESVEANLVGRDPSTDLAVLKAASGSFTAANWTEPDALRVGHLVLALGRPGDQVLATLGVISAIENAWQTRSGGKVDAYLQTDVVMYPGFSGGPLIAVDGTFLGLNTSGFSRGVSLTIPAPTIRRVAQALQQHGHIKRGYLGIGTQAVALPEAVAKQVGQEAGLLVMSVETGTPAESGGILLGDTLLAVDAEAVERVDDLLGLLSGDRVGKQIPIRILRGGEIREINVTVGERQQSSEGEHGHRHGRHGGRGRGRGGWGGR